MNQLTFTKAIQKVFADKSYSFPFSKESTTISGNVLDIENLPFISERLFSIMKNTISKIEAETMVLVDLVQVRNDLFLTQSKLELLERQEKKDVEDIEQNTKWHERSKFVRMFLDSEKGQQLDFEKEDFRQVKSFRFQFNERLSELEAAIAYHILFIGESADTAFNKTVQEWRRVGEINTTSQDAKEAISKAYSSLSRSCPNCGGSNGTHYSQEQMKRGIHYLNKQLNTTQPWYTALTNKVEQTVDFVRGQLSLN